MFTFSPAEAVLAGLLACRRYGALRGTLLGGALVCASIYMLPPVSCGCFGPILRRCDGTLRFWAPVRSDLKNLASQQEIYFSDAYTYSSDPGELAFTPSQGVTVVIEAGAEGWVAWAAHDHLDAGEGCALYVGTPPGGAVGELLADAGPGALRCTRDLP
jgi:hypothetical protein